MEQEEREQLEELQQIRRAFQELAKSKGWGLLANYAKDQIETRRNLISEPAHGLDGMVEQEFAKGEIGGIALFLRFPEIIEADYGEQVDELLKELRENDGENKD